jgi:polyribonucleotide nucleotidyltransferase
MIQLMSYVTDVMPDALAGLASAALALSDIPFETLISEARVEDRRKYHQSSRAELSDIDMMIGASMDSIAMVEGENERNFRSRNA